MKEFGNTFLLNIGMLITIAYLANLIYKYIFSYASQKMKYISSILLVIFSGFICMVYGLRLSENVIFDLRVVPLIIATFSSIGSGGLMIIGVGIGLCRFLFGMSQAALAGFVNLALLGVLAAILHEWLIRKNSKFILRLLAIILVMNVANALNIGWFGVIPFHRYVTEIMPITFTLTTVLTIGFALMFRDFQLERKRMIDLKEANALLKRQTNDLHRTGIILEERAKQLMLASQYKSEFLANMSHELRTPLNSIINFAQLISENGKDKPEEENAIYGDIIYKSGQELLQLINDILDLSKVEAGRLEIEEEEINLRELVGILHMNFEQVASRKGLAFEVVWDEGLPAILWSDPHRVGQILRNLLSNAFKFTEQGKVELKIRKFTPEDPVSGEWLVFAVSDTGIGIPEEKHLTIFEAFQQADGTISRKYGGTGLGLSISRDLARLLDGNIRLQSKEGEGSTFSLYLPLK